MRSAWDLWLVAKRQALRSWLARWHWLRKGVLIAEGVRIPGGGALELRDAVLVQRYSVLNARTGGVIRVGRRSRIGAFAVISAGQLVDIGDDVLIADRVFVSDHHHGFADPGKPVMDQGMSATQPVSIGAGSWLGINVCIMPGVTLGAGCIVGAGSVVTRSFGPGSIVGGAPARLIRLRSDDGL